MREVAGEGDEGLAEDVEELDDDAAEDAVGLPDALDRQDEGRLEDSHLANRPEKVEGGERGEVGSQGGGVAEYELPKASKTSNRMSLVHKMYGKVSISCEGVARKNI